MTPLFLALFGFGFLGLALGSILKTRKFIHRSMRTKAVITEYKDIGVATDDTQIRAIVRMNSEYKKYLVRNLSAFYGMKVGKEIEVYQNSDSDYVLVDGIFALWGPAIVLFIISLLPLSGFIILVQK